MAGGELRVRSGKAAGERISVGRELVLGRAEEPPGDLGGDEELSRRHARIFETSPGRFEIEDLGSTNGTRVNGRRITAVHQLRGGDTIEVGTTKLELEAGAPETRVQTTPPPVARPPAPQQPFAVPPPPPPPDRSRSVPLAALVGLVIGAGAAAGIVLALTGGGSKTATPATPSIPSDCGAKLGGGQPLDFVAYVESNVAKKDGNSVILMPYRSGDLKPLPASQCKTGGSGSADLTDSGVLDEDNQVLLNPERTLLFAVNQGSDSIAVFHVQKKGGLKPVKGSPFPSGGKAPGSLGLSGNTLVVANKAQDGVRNLATVVPTYTTFRVASSGRLTRIRGSTVSALPGASPTDAYVPPGTNVAFATEESGPMRGFQIAANGRLKQAPGSPLRPDRRIFGAGFERAKEFGLGMAALGTRNIVYIGMPTVPALAVYSFTTAGSLKFVNSVPVRGAYLPCWVVVAPGDRWLFTANADTNNVIAFDLARPTAPKQIQTFTFNQFGNPWNMATDSEGRYLFVNAPRDTIKVPAGMGNIQHVLRIGTNGRLRELATSPAVIPVPQGVNPQGLAIFPLKEQPVQ